MREAELRGDEDGMDDDVCEDAGVVASEEGDEKHELELNITI